MLARTVAAGLGVLLLAGCGVSGNFRHDPGYASFGVHGPLATDRELGISLGPLPLAFARFVLDDDDEIGAVLRGLRAVRVYSYDVTHDAEAAADEVHAIQSRLIHDGWIALLTVTEAAEQTAVLLRPASDGRRNRGLAVIVRDSHELVLVNLIGDVRLDLFNEYMAELDLETPGIENDPRALRVGVR